LGIPCTASTRQDVEPVFSAVVADGRAPQRAATRPVSSPRRREVLGCAAVDIL
jgi:hypothetical protein